MNDPDEVGSFRCVSVTYMSQTGIREQTRILHECARTHEHEPSMLLSPTHLHYLSVRMKALRTGRVLCTAIPNCGSADQGEGRQ